MRAPWMPMRIATYSVLIESELKLRLFVLTRFLHANRYPLRSKTLQRGRATSGPPYSAGVAMTVGWLTVSRASTISSTRNAASTSANNTKAAVNEPPDA